jgi:hypothetical protein
VLPEVAMNRLIDHTDSGRSLSVEYGWNWRRPDRPARAGCLVGVGLSPEEFAAWSLQSGPGGDLVWLAEEVFPGWASRWVSRPDESLPPPALAVIRSLLRA